ncbi:MAG: epoxyqueuosine reductase [Desulfuromonadaceae bacterium]|nr:epoxyqueuosine reductase [Desulfuromonadaceae bacterium]MDD5107222.1 epoxyqueuosine reductase [Desulfuromonadaceae bacterium]
MENSLIEEICRFVCEDSGNGFSDRGERYFDDPLIGFSSATDPLFTEYKSVIGPFHLTPGELVSLSTPNDVWVPATVVSWVLPITSKTRISNRSESVYPSQEWATTRNFGEQFNTLLRRHMITWLTDRGYRAAAPQLMPAWQEFRDTSVGIASTWSERHAAYAAGLGTFSLTDALITPQGIAHRLGSVITNLKLEPSQRPYPERRANCLHYRENSCGACIARCPVGALSRDGHDKSLCREYVYSTIPAAVGKRYGVTASGCGLCQTRVPCEGTIPVGRKPYPA